MSSIEDFFGEDSEDFLTFTDGTRVSTIDPSIPPIPPGENTGQTFGQLFLSLLEKAGSGPLAPRPKLKPGEVPTGSALAGFSGAGMPGASKLLLVAGAAGLAWAALRS